MLKKIKFWFYQFLRRTQKYTKTDNVYLAKGGSWLTLSQIGGMVIFFILGIIWARFVPKEIYGQYSFILSIAGLLAIFSLLGMKAATTQAVAQGFDGTIKPILKTKFRWSTLTLLVSFFFALYYWTQGNQTLAIAFLIAGALSPFLNNFPVYTNYLAGKKRFDLQAQYSLARTFLAAAATVIAIFLTKNVIYLVAVYFVANSLLHAFFYFFTLKKIPPSQHINPQSIKYGKHLSLIGIIGKISAHLDKILVFHYLGAAELAIYAFAVALPSYIGTPTQALREIALPKLTVRDEKELKKTVWPKALRFGLFLAIGIALYILLAEVIFKIFFPNYMESVFYSRIYALSIIGNVTFMTRLTFIAKKKSKMLYKYTTSMNLTRILILFISVYFWGLLGIMLGHVISSFLGILIAFLLFRSYAR